MREILLQRIYDILNNISNGLDANGNPAGTSVGNGIVGEYSIINISSVAETILPANTYSAIELVVVAGTVTITDSNTTAVVLPVGTWPISVPSGTKISNEIKYDGSGSTNAFLQLIN